MAGRPTRFNNLHNRQDARLRYKKLIGPGPLAEKYKLDLNMEPQYCDALASRGGLRLDCVLAQQMIADLRNCRFSKLAGSQR